MGRNSRRSPFPPALAAAVLGGSATMAPAQCDPQEVAKLLADDGGEFQHFGVSVSVDGNTALIVGDGAAYVFDRIGGVWTQTDKLTAADGGGFGQVSISGDTALMGASGDDDNGEGSGSAYVFERIGGAWTETAKLTASDGAPGDAFGFAVDVDGDVALVGAWLDDDNGNDSGSAYAFERIEGVWNETAKLSAPDFGPFDFFGDSVSVSGATAVVSAIRDDDAGNNAGAAYVFEKIDGAWTQTAKLTGADTEAYDNFGDWVSLSGSTLLIGAWQDDDNGTDSGSAYVFERGGGVWTETAKLTAADGAEGDHFGWAVGVGDDVAVVGANFDDDHGDGSGSAYVFKRVGAKWTQAAKVTPSGGAAADLFGNAIALGGDAAFIASPADDDNGTESGSVFVFDLNCSCPADVSGDGELSILDFIVFQALWQDGDPGADCDANGVFNVLDFVCFQQLFQEGCQ